ncbi:NAD-dependent deacylase [Prosthecobacter sp.]|uniref:NAD-dependent deacylase n=1 Tax=Prosthecobacter sp. TaxID=1965333 RepID=UPI0024887347|nr:NAD-dependent deacylase [Prosthecobacter sp.]MDI1311277.1 NAD-dependent deacylase [Prosthecobacter sp.]
MSAGQNIVVLTGAGMSAESGVPTFRGVDGLWEGHRIEEVASPEGFARDPELVHHFYNLRRAALNTVEPNAGHLALVKLEREWRGKFLLVTQNVDDLHERAGSEKLIHMHGELRKARCECCGAVLSWTQELSSGTRCRACGEIGGLRPHIVWFGEFPFEMETIMSALEGADVFLCIGTSGVVYPAAGFAQQVASHSNCRLIEINIERTEISRHFHEHIVGPVSAELPKLVERLLSA